MNLDRLVVGPGDVNCYIITDDNKKGFIVDPGGDQQQIITYIKENDIILEAIILTHHHYDHILAVNALKTEFNLPVWIHQDDFAGLANPELNLSAHRPVPDTGIVADRALEDAQVIAVGDLELEIIHTPGHTPGCICIKVADLLITGDTVFKDSVGRTDLIGGSYEQLKASIINKIMPLDDRLLVYPGHREPSVLGLEKKHNPKIQKMLAKGSDGIGD